MTRPRITQALLRLRVPVHHVSRRYESSTAFKENSPGPWPSKNNFSLRVGSGNFKPNTYVRNVTAENNIGFPSEVARLKLDLKPNHANIQVFVSNRHCIHIYDMKYFADYIHPYTQTVLDRYISQVDRPLWWSISSFGDATRIVITKAERWLRRGIRLALEAKGYDRYGKSVTRDVGGRTVQDIYGTLRVTCPQAKVLCQLKFPEVQELSTKIVDALEKRHQRDATGSHIAANQGQAKPFGAPNGQVRKKMAPEKTAQAGSKTQKGSGSNQKAQNTKQVAQKAHKTTQRVLPTTLKNDLGKENTW